MENQSNQKEIKHLSLLAELATHINLGTEIDKLIDYILGEIINILDAESATLFFVDDTKRFLIPKVIKGPRSIELKSVFEKLKISFGQGIVGWAAQLGTPVIINNPYNHPKFSKEFDIIAGYVTRNILCVPLQIEKKLKGIIEVVNKKDGQFTEDDSALLHASSTLLILAIENDKIIEDIRKTSNFYKTIIESMSGGFISVGNDMKVINFNQSASYIMGISKTQVIGKNFKEAFIQYPEISKIISQTLNEKITVSRYEVEFFKVNSGKIKIGYSTLLINDKSGEQLGAGIIFQKLA